VHHLAPRCRCPWLQFLKFLAVHFSPFTPIRNTYRYILKFTRETVSIVCQQCRFCRFLQYVGQTCNSMLTSPSNPFPTDFSAVIFVHYLSEHAFSFCTNNWNMQHVSTIEMKICVERNTNTWVTIYQTTQLNIPVTWLQEPQISGDLDRLLGTSKLIILYVFFQYMWRSVKLALYLQHTNSAVGCTGTSLQLQWLH